MFQKSPETTIFLIQKNNNNNMKQKDIIIKENIEEQEEKDSPIKKIIILIVAIFLILLIISFTITQYPIGEILQGQASSVSIKDNKLITKELEIIFLNNTENILSDLYNQEQEINLVETSTCVLGEKINEKTYIINSIFYPEITEQSFRHVQFSSCPMNTLVMLHTHPYKHCLASKTDIATLEKVKKANSNIIMIVMCEQNRYSIYK